MQSLGTGSFSSNTFNNKLKDALTYDFIDGICLLNAHKVEWSPLSQTWKA